MSFLKLGGHACRWQSSLHKSRTRRMLAGCCFLYFLIHSLPACAQAGYEIDLKKPPKFEDKILASEKSTSTKNTVLRRFVQGTVTHYNYYFNANQKILLVLANAKSARKEDLTTLLPFYSYSLADTRTQASQLDSVIYKCTAGIVLHDLRNGWIDNLYLLIGQAYFFEAKFDSADRILQFLNYHFYIKEKGDYHIPIGTNSQSQNGQVSILNPENHSLGHEAFNRAPSRNDGLIFQVRSYTEQGRYTEAAGLTSLLKTDPLFPERLKAPLAEQEAYWYYSQQRWDSAAVYLEKALPNAFNGQELARWEYLLAQLYERCHKPDAAISWYDKAILHSTDPRLDIYARLYKAILAEGRTKEALPQTIQALLKLANKERFNPFRDILYLAAARLALEEPDTVAAYHYLHLCVGVGGKGEIKDRAFLLMSQLGLAQSNYKIVATSYDSLQLQDPIFKDSSAQMARDRTLYNKALVSILAIEKEDSLQRIAAMPLPERTAYVKDLLRKLLKAQGVKDNTAAFGRYSATRDSLSKTDLFNSGGGNGEWYFYNQVTLAQGAQDFEAKWGSRPNVDNWRRSSAMGVRGGNNILQSTTEETLNAKKTVQKEQVLTLSAMMANLPVTPPLLEASNDTVALNLYRLGTLYKDQIGDNRAAVAALESLYTRYPTYQTEETLFNLFLCWHRLGNLEKANYYLDLLHKHYPASKYINRLTPPAPTAPDTVALAATEKYKMVYDQFIAGNYDSALVEKKELDSIFGKKYWTPQLMYIQAVYFAHERQDTLALAALNSLVTQFPKDPLTPRATKLRDVIRRRPAIEQYLTQLKVERDKVDSLHIDTGSVAAAPPPPPPPPPGPPDLHKARGNTADSLLGSPMSQNGTLAGRSAMHISPSAMNGAHSDNYAFDPSAPHLVLLVMTQVAGVYAAEAKNAFNRYNSDVHYQEDIPLDTLVWGPGINMLRMGPFKNIVDAIAYEMELQKKAAKEIIPWLSADKYRFLVISQDNLAVLRQKRKLDEYAAFIDSYLKDLPPVK